MSNTGLSSLNFMDGLMKGATFVNGFQQQKRANDIEDKKLAMAETTHNQQTKLNDLSIQGKETEALIKEFDRDTRLFAESGKAPDDGFFNKYSRLLRPVLNEENRRRQVETYKGLKAAVDNDDYGPDFHKHMNMALKDRFDRLKEMDGLDRQFVGAKEVPTGYDDDGDGVQDTYMVPVLQVTRPDGTKYLAPYTKNGTADPDDDVVLFNDDLMGEFIENMRQRADLATELHQFSDDPRKQIAALRRGVLGPQDVGYEFKEAYDPVTGTKRLAAVDPKKGDIVRWIGGASRNDGKGYSAAGAGKNDKNGILDVEGYLKRRQEIRTSTAFTTEEERAAAFAQNDQDARFEFGGADPETVLEAQQYFINNGDYSPLTRSKLAAYTAGLNAGLGEASKAGSAADGSTGAKLSDADPLAPPPASPPPSPQLSQAQSNVIDTAMVELERIQGVINNPDAKPAERRDAQKLRAQIFKDMKPKERQMVEAQLKRQRTLAKERGEEEQMAAEIASLQQRISNPDGYRTDIERAMDQRKLIELLEKRSGKSNPVAGL
ncbi:hypothetical protein GJQ54_05395 [Oceanospirillaceae bacterium ASx5O]|nr:hypothetical protein GJQ54_05395 [Oceanospirillaceae bacterium ASx5O]